MKRRRPPPLSPVELLIQREFVQRPPYFPSRVDEAQLIYRVFKSHIIVEDFTPIILVMRIAKMKNSGTPVLAHYTASSLFLAEDLLTCKG